MTGNTKHVLVEIRSHCRMWVSDGLIWNYIDVVGRVSRVYITRPRRQLTLRQEVALRLQIVRSLDG